LRNLELEDAVIALHDTARTVEKRIGRGQLSDDIRSCADRLHQYLRTDASINILTQNISNKAEE